MMGEGFLLTDAEKHRFLQWATMRAESSKGMIRQMESAGLMPVMITREKTLLAAYMILIGELQSGESMTLTPTGNSEGEGE